jgi:hypothetical protein
VFVPLGAFAALSVHTRPEHGLARVPRSDRGLVRPRRKQTDARGGDLSQLRPTAKRFVDGGFAAQALRELQRLRQRHKRTLVIALPMQAGSASSSVDAAVEFHDRGSFLEGFVLKVVIRCNLCQKAGDTRGHRGHVDFIGFFWLGRVGTQWGHVGTGRRHHVTVAGCHVIGLSLDLVVVPAIVEGLFMVPSCDAAGPPRQRACRHYHYGSDFASDRTVAGGVLGITDGSLKIGF